MVTVPPPSIDAVVVKTRVTLVISRVVLKPITSTVKPDEVGVMIFTELAVISGAVFSAGTGFEGGGVGRTLSMPASSLVRVKVMVPATEPGEKAPLLGRTAVLEPLAMVKLIEVPPAAN